jgi:hypothetical protein
MKVEKEKDANAWKQSQLHAKRRPWDATEKTSLIG